MTLMPKARAVWLIENTSLTFKQIADFCGLHELEVENIANEESAKGLKGVSPIITGETTLEEIERCQKDPNAHLQYFESEEYNHFKKKSEASSKQNKTKRKNKLEGILWVISHYPNVSDADLGKIFATTANVVKSVRSKSYWDYKNLVAKNPITLELCTEEDLHKLIHPKEQK